MFRDLDVPLVELSAGEEPPNPDLRDPAQVEEVAALAEQLGIYFYAVHTEFRGRWNLASSDPETRRFALEANRAVIRAACRLGSRHVVLHPGQELVEGEPVADQLLRAEESLRRLGPVAQEAGLMVAVENLPSGHVGSSLGQMAMLLQALDPGVFGFCCDTGHAAVSGEGPAAYVRAFAPRLLGIHMHDNGGEDDHRFPGLGSIDWEDFFAALREVGYTLPITVEALPPPDLPLPQAAAIVRESAATLRPPLFPARAGRQG
jgi:sugar phosphate isomerase/epimerase